jgi:hypothetical protein
MRPGYAGAASALGLMGIYVEKSDEMGQLELSRFAESARLAKARRTKELEINSVYA